MKKELMLIARKLRNYSTDAEKYLWNELRNENLGVRFKRQAVIGQYIVDFVSFERKLIIEVDGGQHAENESDNLRDQWLIIQGFKVLRLWNSDVLNNRSGVVEKIQEFLNSPSPSSSPKGRGIKERGKII